MYPRYPSHLKTQSLTHLSDRYCSPIDQVHIPLIGFTVNSCRDGHRTRRLDWRELTELDTNVRNTQTSTGASLYMSEYFRVDRVQGRSTGCPGQLATHRKETNVWVLGDGRDVVIIDPAGFPELVADAVDGRKVTAVICTHGHRAHIAAAMVLGEDFCAPVLLHVADHVAWQEVHGQRRYWQLHSGQRIAVAGEEIHVLHKPTATPGSVSLHVVRHNMAFTGDALPHRSSGRNQHQAVVVPEMFAALSPDTRIHPGHGNRYLLGAMFSLPSDRSDRQSA